MQSTLFPPHRESPRARPLRLNTSGVHTLLSEWRSGFRTTTAARAAASGGPTDGKPDHRSPMRCSNRTLESNSIRSLSTEFHRHIRTDDGALGFGSYVDTLPPSRSDKNDPAYDDQRAPSRLRSSWSRLPRRGGRITVGRRSEVCAIVHHRPRG